VSSFQNATIFPKRYTVNTFRELEEIAEVINAMESTRRAKIDPATRCRCGRCIRFFK